MQEEVSKIKTENSLIIGFTEYQNAFPNNTYLSFGSIQDYKEISHNIFKLLRQAEKYNPDKIIIMGVNKEGIGVAIMNRLMRACEFNYIERSY